MDATTRQLSEQKKLIGELELKVHLLTDNYVAVSYFRKHSATQDEQIAVLEGASANLNI